MINCAFKSWNNTEAKDTIAKIMGTIIFAYGLTPTEIQIKIYYENEIKWKEVRVIEKPAEAKIGKGFWDLIPDGCELSTNEHYTKLKLYFEVPEHYYY